MMYGHGLLLRSRRVIGGSPILWTTGDMSLLTPGSMTAAAFLAATGITATCASGSRSVQTGANTVATGIGVDAVAVRSDGIGVGALIEHASSNSVYYSRDIGNAAWTAGTGTVGAAIAGPDGTVTAKRQTLVGASKYGSYQSFALAGRALAARPYCTSLWCRTPSGSGSQQLQTLIGTSSGLLLMSATESWQRFSRVSTSGGDGAPYATTFDTYDRTAMGGIAPTGADGYPDMFQVEPGLFPTSYIPTTNASVTRSGVRWTVASPTSLLSSGRLGLEAAIRPLGASSEYTANMRLWTADANNYAEVNATTRIMSVTIAGVTASFPTPLPTWARYDLLEMWQEGGGGLLQSVGKARVNGGAVTSLGTLAAQPAIVVGANSLDLGCNGTLGQFTGSVKSLSTYAADTRPAWAS